MITGGIELTTGEGDVPGGLPALMFGFSQLASARLLPLLSESV
jgi:hypothetical protein